MGIIDEILKRQFERCFATLAEVVEGCPEGQWKTSDHPRFIPSRLALHILETVEYYIGDSREFKESRFGDSEILAPGALPSKKDIAEYFEVVKNRLDEKLSFLMEEEFLSPETIFSDREEGYTLLDLFIYVLCHTQYHGGQLVEEMRRSGIGGPRWH